MLSYLCTALKMSNQILLDSLWSVVSSGTTCSYVCLLFVKVLVCFHACCLKCCLLHNFLQKNDKMVKPILLVLLRHSLIFTFLFQVFLANCGGIFVNNINELSLKFTSLESIMHCNARFQFNSEFPSLAKKVRTCYMLASVSWQKQ